MRHIYTSFTNNRCRLLAVALLPLLLLLPLLTSAQTPYKLADGNYTQSFASIATWTNDFAAGDGAAAFSKALPSPTLPTQNNVFVTGSSGGVQRGTESIVLLATGSTDGSNAAAFDLSLDFTGMTAGTVSVDWASVNNSTGDRKSTFTIQANTGAGGAFVDLPGSSVTITNNTLTNGVLAQLALPSEFNGKADAKLRFYLVTIAGGTTGSRPKINLDNIAVTATVIPTGPEPSLIASLTTLPSFGEVEVGSASGIKTFTVSGQNLTGDITVTPAAGFEIRVGSNAFACCEITLAVANGTLESTSIEVRFAPIAAEAYNGNIVISGGGVTSQNVAVSGTGIVALHPATLATSEVTEITATSAVAGGEITADGGSPVTARGVVWATTVNPTLENSKTTDGAGTGAFVSNITGLTHSTVYYVRAYATNGVGTTYGQERTFTTTAIQLASEPSTASTIAISEVTATSMKLTLEGGNGTKRIVFARQGSAVDGLPEDGKTYTANAVFKEGQELGTGNFVVFNGTGNEVVVTGLRGEMEYHFAVLEYNDNNTEAAENYLTSTVGRASQTTLKTPAVLAFEENFDYTAATLLTDNGWTAHSGTTNLIPVASSGLSYSGYVSSGIGNSAEIKASGQDVNRTFTKINAGTPVYVAFMVNTASANVAGDYFLHLGPSNMGTSIFRSRVYVRATASGKVQYGVSGSGATPVYTTEEYDVNTTNLLVLKYTFDETGNKTALYVNPTLNTEPTIVKAELAEAGDKSPIDINTIALRQGTSSPVLVIDGLRVATSYNLALGTTATLPAVTFTNATISKAEDAGKFNVSLTLSEGVATEQTVTITPAASSTATAADYTITGATNGAVTVTIPANATTASFEVAITDDTETEAAEQVVFEISNPSSGLVLGTAKTFTLTIEANDTPTPATVTFTSASISKTEDAGSFNVSLTLSKAVATAQTVTIAPVAGGTASAADYTLTGATNNALTVTIPANATSATFGINITDDIETEAAEQVVFEISNPSNMLVLGTAKTFTLTIEANDAPTGIADGTKGQFSVYPTLVNDSHVSLLLPERVAATAKVTMVVYSAEGRKVLTTTGTQSAVQGKLNSRIANLPAGIYMILIETGKEYFQTKMVKN